MYTEEYAFALKTVKEAGAIARAAFGYSVIEYKKSDVTYDVVTEADREIDAFIRDAIRSLFPSHSIRSEENDAEGVTHELVWSIDPIDGSSNFSRSIPHFAISLGLLDRGVPVVGAIYNPTTDELFSFVKGGGAFLNEVSLAPVAKLELAASTILFTMGSRQEKWDWGFSLYRHLAEADARVRNFGASALDLCYLAAGRVDAVIYGGMSLLDVAPAIGVLREVGGDIYVFETGEQASLGEQPQTVVATQRALLSAAIRAL